MLVGKESAKKRGKKRPDELLEIKATYIILSSSLCNMNLLLFNIKIHISIFNIYRSIERRIRKRTTIVFVTIKNIKLFLYT